MLNQIPGREAFPGSIFYIHANILERFYSLRTFFRSGSSTCFPVIEIKQNDTTSFIATNVISITDGQWLLDTRLSKKGGFPSINFFKSVSRIGSAAQIWFFKLFKARLFNLYVENKRIDALIDSNISLSKNENRLFKWSNSFNKLYYNSNIQTFLETVLFIIFALIGQTTCSKFLITELYLSIMCLRSRVLEYLVSFSMFWTKKKSLLKKVVNTLILKYFFK